MSGKIIGYIRVSTYEQNPDRQLENYTVDKVFIDRCSGETKHRPQLQALLEYVREGDTIVVHSLDRLARNLEDLRTLVQSLNQKDVKVHFLKENLIFTGEDSPMSTLLLSVMGAFAEFERSLILERQQEGIALAKKKGVYRGRKRCFSDDEKEEIIQKIKTVKDKSQLARELKVSRYTLYNYLKKDLADKTTALLGHD